LEFNILK